MTSALKWMVPLACALAVSLASGQEKTAFKPVAEKTRLAAAEDLSETSGLAVSPRNGAFLWLLNDSGAKPELRLAGADGSDRGFVSVNGARNVDWEDLAAFQLNGTSFLLIADSGDNNSKRKDCRIYVVSEPALPANGGKLSGSIDVGWTFPFGFDEGPRDCEAVAVDAEAGKIILLSKRTKPPVVYELPLHSKGPEKVMARKIGVTSVALPKGALPLPFHTQPTGMDISVDGTLAAVVTYYSVYLFPRAKKETWTQAFARPAVILPPHGLPQAESVAISADGGTITVVSEGDSRLIRYRK